MTGRFDLFVVLRNQVSDRRRRRRALAVEAVMEDLAGALGDDAVAWGIAGLGADIDCELTAENPERRGAVAAELLATEGVSAEICAAVRERISVAPERMTRLAAALVAAEGLVDEVFLDLEEVGLDDVDPSLVIRRLERDERATACLPRLGIEPERAARLAQAAMLRIREDLRR